MTPNSQFSLFPQQSPTLLESIQLGKPATQESYYANQANLGNTTIPNFNGQSQVSNAVAGITPAAQPNSTSGSAFNINEALNSMFGNTDYADFSKQFKLDNDPTGLSDLQMIDYNAGLNTAFQNSQIGQYGAGDLFSDLGTGIDLGMNVANFFDNRKTNKAVRRNIDAKTGDIAFNQDQETAFKKNTSSAFA